MRAGAARGFTLLELMVTVAISIITASAGTTLLLQVLRSYRTTSGERAQQEAGRAALQELAARLKQAGYGVDPNLAFDFGSTVRAPRPNLRGMATWVSVSSYGCGASPGCRDSTTPDRSDEIVFLERDPTFRRVASAVTPQRLTLVGQLKAPLRAGQILQVSCAPGGNRVRAYVTVARQVAATPDPSATAPVEIPLRAGQPGPSGEEVFPYENGQLVDRCFSPTDPNLRPIVTKVDRFRYYVAWFEGDDEVDPQVGQAKPYLMLDQGLEDDAGNALRVPVATDVEDLQFAYTFRPAVPGDPPRVVGARPGVGITAGTPLAMAAGATVPPAMSDPLDAPSRLTGHAANIQAVRISVVVRQGERDLTAPGDTTTVPAAGNRPAYQGQPGYRRALWETTVVPRNLTSSYFPYPI